MAEESKLSRVWRIICELCEDKEVERLNVRSFLKADVIVPLLRAAIPIGILTFSTHTLAAKPTTHMAVVCVVMTSVAGGTYALLGALSLLGSFVRKPWYVSVCRIVVRYAVFIGAGVFATVYFVPWRQVTPALMNGYADFKEQHKDEYDVRRGSYVFTEGFCEFWLKYEWVQSFVFPDGMPEGLFDKDDEK